MDDGTRTRDFRHHKPALYRLSYAHHALLLPPSDRKSSVQTVAAETVPAAAFASSEVGPGSGAKTVRR